MVEVKIGDVCPCFQEEVMAKFILSSFADEASPMLDEQFEASKAHGFTHIEVRGVDEKNMADYSVDQAKEIARRFEAAGIQVSALGSPFGKIDITADFEPHAEYMKKGLEIANILGTKRVRLFSFFMPKGEDPAVYREEVFARMDKMADLCKQAGLLCCHENEKDIYGDTIDRTLDLLKTFEGRIVGVFDPANFIQCGQDTWQAWQTLAPYIDYIHIKDCKADGTIMPAGRGIGHIPDIIRAYGQKDGDRFITLEPHLMEFTGLQGLEKDDVSNMHHEFTFENNRQSFDYAADSLKEIIASVLSE